MFIDQEPEENTVRATALLENFAPILPFNRNVSPFPSSMVGGSEEIYLSYQKLFSREYHSTISLCF